MHEVDGAPATSLQHLMPLATACRGDLRCCYILIRKWSNVRLSVQDCRQQPLQQAAT